MPLAAPLFPGPVQNASTNQTPSNDNIQTSRVDKPPADLNTSVNTIDTKMVPECDKVFDTRYYNELMDSVPVEYVSTGIMLHCMVEQIVATEEKRGLPSETYVDASVPQIANFDLDLCKHLSKMVNGLGLDEKEVKVSRLMRFNWEDYLNWSCYKIHFTNVSLNNYLDSCHVLENTGITKDFNYMI